MASDVVREIPGSEGPLEALLDEPEGEPRAVAVFGHPHPLHGGTMHTKALYQAAKAMPRIGVAALRFNFRGVGRSAGTFDAGPGERDDFRAAISFVRERYPDLPIWAAGHRFADTGGIDVPALIITGEPGLDRVVPVDVTRRYLDELHSARHVVLERTGHNGLVTRPGEFADLLGRFVDGVRLSA